METESRITHVAGEIVYVNGRMIQRCPICGIALLNRVVPATTEGIPYTATWMPGHYVKDDEEGTKWYMSADSEDLPTDLCLNYLVE